MKIYGLTTSESALRYLDAIGVERIAEYDDIPLFTRDSHYFFGGFKNFYSLVPDASREGLIRTIECARIAYPTLQCDIASRYDTRKSDLCAWVLDIRGRVDPASRFGIYHKKTRNQVRKSYQNDLRIEIGSPPRDFYDLYLRNMARFGSKSKEKSWFENLEKHLADDVVCVSAYRGDTLVGVNYAVRSDSYCMLMFNVSDQDAWRMNVNDRLYDELVAWAIANKIDFLDFGPSVRNDASHAHFKEGFGARRWYISQKQFGPIFLRFLAWCSQRRHNMTIRMRRAAMIRKP